MKDKIYKVELDRNPAMKVEKPEVMTFRNVMYWCPESKQLLEKKQNGDTQAATLLTKAKKFLEYNCIERAGFHFICKPIEGYNQTEYKIMQDVTGEVKICNCQGFEMNKYCSHILAVEMFDYMEKNNGN